MNNISRLNLMQLRLINNNFYNFNKIISILNKPMTSMYKLWLLVFIVDIISNKASKFC